MQDRQTGERVELTEQELGQAVKHLLKEHSPFSATVYDVVRGEGPAKLPYSGIIHVNTPEFKATRKYIEKKRRQAKSKGKK
jgi:hypothetical protein